MARLFDGVDDVITATLPSAITTTWTFTAWVRPASAGEGNAGRIIDMGSRNFRLGAGLVVTATQSYSTTNAVSTSNETLPADEWSFVVAVHNASTKVTHLFIGDLDTPLTEVTYASQVTGVGTFTAGTAAIRLGNNGAGSATFDGRMAQVLASLGDLSGESATERLRLRTWPFGDSLTIHKGFWPLTSPTASEAEDALGLAHGTVSGCTVAEDPPTFVGWGQPVLTASAPSHIITGTQADETDSASGGALVAALPGSLATETDTANTGSLLAALAGATATETDSALAGLGLIAWPGTQATETDTAFGGVEVSVNATSTLSAAGAATSTLSVTPAATSTHTTSDG